MALGFTPSCCILIFSFLRFLTIYQVTATILFSNIPLLAAVRYNSVDCSDPITFWFIDFSSFCCWFSSEQIFSLLITDAYNENGSFISFSYIVFLLLLKSLSVFSRSYYPPPEPSNKSLDFSCFMVNACFHHRTTLQKASLGESDNSWVLTPVNYTVKYLFYQARISFQNWNKTRARMGLKAYLCKETWNNVLEVLILQMVCLFQLPQTHTPRSLSLRLWVAGCFNNRALPGILLFLSIFKAKPLDWDGQWQE